MKVMLAGDVMLGRGIDQVLPHPGSPEIFEPYVRSALTYVELAEARNGAIPRKRPFDYVWGDALAALDAAAPACRIINLETAVTRRGQPAPKGINYRMTPENLPVLSAAAVDCCVLANNHMLDWGAEGLEDTLETLDGAGVAHAGAGRDSTEACTPAILSPAPSARLLVHAVAHFSSGVPPQWAAGVRRPGVDFLPDLDEDSAETLAERLASERRPGDVVLLSIHWAPNWGYRLEEEGRFAHRLIDAGAVDIIHGHSSHHPKGIERYRGRLILYGCGDLLNDYEGIAGHEDFHPDLSLIYLPTIEAGGRCVGLDLLPFRIGQFRLNAASRTEAQWLAAAIARHSPRAGDGLAISLVEPVSPAHGAVALSVRFDG